jgi:hypothetical protein
VNLPDKFALQSFGFDILTEISFLSFLYFLLLFHWQLGKESACRIDATFSHLLNI